MSLRTLLALASTTLILGCYAEPFGQDAETAVDLNELTARPAADVFDAAGAEHGVPADLLAAIAWHTSSFAPGDHDHDEHEPAHGWMGLRPDQVETAAALTGLTAHAIAETREGNIFGAAAILADLQTRAGGYASPVVADDLWWGATVAWSDFTDEWMNHEFAMDVFRTLQRGLHVPTVSGDIVTIPGREIPGLANVRFIEGPRAESGLFHGTIDYPGAARFVPAHSSNQSYRSNGASSIRRVVIHTVEGSYNGAISWFKNPSANVSAHYVVRKSDGEVTQQVRDARKAWHVCGSNNDTIGIEHEGAASNAATWTPEILDASARLTAWLVTKYNIPIDRNHIVGHGEIQGAGCAYRYDPGPHFPWTQYMNMVQNFASGGTSGSAPPDDLPEMPSLPDGPAPASITFQTPTQGATVANPVIMRVANTGIDHMELWAGPYLLAHHLTANPVNVGYRFSVPGNRTLTARGYSDAGALLATDSVNVTVSNVATTLNPGATKVSGPTYRISANGAAVGAAYTKYWVDGWPLRDDSTNSHKAPSPSYGLTYTFSHTAPGRLLQARAYASDGRLLGEGFSYIDVDGSTGEGGLIEVEGYEVSGQVIRLTSTATPGVAEVEYVWNGTVLADIATGATRGVPDEYAIFYDFPVSGPQNIVVRAFNAAGALVDTTTVSVDVPSDSLEVTWTRSAWHQYRFQAVAPAGSYKLVIEIDGWALPDQNTNNQYTLGPDFILDYRFNYGGTRELHAKVYDPVGNLVDEYITDIEVY